MKKLLLIAFVAMLTSCTSTKFVSKNVYFLDFRPYSEKGFLMSTTLIGASYSSIGEINVTCQSGYILGDKKNKSSDWHDQYTSSASITVTKKTPRKQWTIDEVLAELYNEAKSVGANGVINIKVETNYSEGFTDFIISGLAVKIEN